ncbi:MAG: tetratricopeptide repeat protein [Muribaculaceae bacterium]
MKKLIKIFVACTLTLAACTEARAAEPEYFRWIGEADKAVAAKDWDRALQCYDAAMKSEPDNANNVLVLGNLGMVQYYAGRDSLALETLTKAHVMAPKSTTLLLNRGKVLADMGRYDDAVADFTQVLDIDSVNTGALFNRGYIRLRKGDNDGAEADLLKYSQLAPDDLNSISSLAVLYSNTDRFKEAIPFYDKLIEKRPNGDAYAARAFCKLTLEDLTGASEDISEGLKIDPNNGELYYARAYLNHLRYLDEDAKADAKRAEEFGVEKERIKMLFQ